MKRKLADNLKHVQDRIAAACTRAKRDPADVKLVAVTKTATVDLVRMLIDLGVEHLGESRVSEFIRRAAMLNEWRSRQDLVHEPGRKAPQPQWHMIGHLQRNKVKMLLPWVDMIHSVDSLRLAEELDQHAQHLGRVIPILLEVNASGESSKQGVAVAAATHLAEQIVTLNNLELRGFMTMAPLTEDQSVIRRVFERARELFDETVSLRIGGPAFKELSMGMSHDFEAAIAAGATYVRIGSLLFEGIELAPLVAETE